MKTVLIALLILCGVVDAAKAEGPWSGRVIVAGTERPVSDAVVIVYWERRIPGIIHEGIELDDVVEVVTNAEGKFVIPARHSANLSLFFRVEGPRMQIFRAGFIGWHFRGQPDINGPLNVVDRDAWIAAAWRRFATTGEVIELDEARTWEERNKALVIASPMGPFPDNKIPRYRKALDDEESRLRRLRYGGT
jgi:hypothetical protein